MCGIIGLFNAKDCKKRLEKSLKKIHYRGKDGNKIICTDNYGLGHNLHAIIDIVEQPLEDRFVANCEIYNWKELNSKYGLKAKNDAELALKMLDKKGLKALDEFDGIYAIGYIKDEKLYLMRDLIGIKPIWFSVSDGLGFASEKKALEEMGFFDIEELNPRKILIYDVKDKKIEFREREFFKVNNVKDDFLKIKEKLQKLLGDAIDKRGTDKKIGILFSGGIDSTLIAYMLKNMGYDFTCYTAALSEPGMKVAEDLVYAKKVAKKLGFKLKCKKLRLDEVEKYLKQLVPLIEDSNVVKVGVGITFFVACELAKKDNVKVLFSGLGSEEIFAGYERHDRSHDINKECLYGLKQMYQRDLYRDDVISMFHTMELRVPMLDTKLVSYSLGIPAKYKIRGAVKKYILREVARDMGMPEEFALRKKKAAQYGSKFDKAIAKLAKKEGKSKSEYLRQFYPQVNLKIGVLFSSGKDSTYAAYIMNKMNYELSCLITMKSINPYSYMFHTPNIDIADLQAKAMGLPLITGTTVGEKEKELKDLKKLINEAKIKYNLDGIVTGALFSTYQRNRIEKICDQLSLKAFSPLWHKDQELLMRELLENDFTIIFSSVAAYGLDKSWLGKEIKMKDVDKLSKLNKKIGFNTAGEGGEFESLVVDCPMFNKKIKIVASHIVEEDENTAKFFVDNAKLIEK